MSAGRIYRAVHEGRDIPKRPTFAAEMSNIQNQMKGTSADNKQLLQETRSNAFTAHGGFVDYPKWYAKVAAYYRKDIEH